MKNFWKDKYEKMYQMLQKKQNGDIVDVGKDQKELATTDEMTNSISDDMKTVQQGNQVVADNVTTPQQNASKVLEGQVSTDKLNNISGNNASAGAVQRIGGAFADGLASGGVVGGVIKGIMQIFNNAKESAEQAKANAQNMMNETNSVSKNKAMGLKNNALSNTNQLLSTATQGLKSGLPQVLQTQEQQFPNQDKGLIDTLLSKYIGQPTGGASNVTNLQQPQPQVQPQPQQQAQPYNDSTVLGQQQNYLMQKGYDKKVVDGIAQGLNSGLPELASWNNDYKKSAEGQKLGYNIPDSKNAEQVELAKQGKFNNINTQPLQGGATQHGKLIDKLANGIADFRNGFNENLNNGFKPENMYSNTNKSFVNRLGEGLGTASRIAQNPLVQGAVGAALTGGAGFAPLIMAGVGRKVANNKQNSDYLDEMLVANGLKPVGGYFGSTDNTTFNTAMEPKYKKDRNDTLKEIADDKIALEMEKLEETKDYHDMLHILKKMALQNKGKGGGKGGGNTNPDKTDEIVTVLDRDGNEFKIPKSKAKDFIKKYGGGIV